MSPDQNSLEQQLDAAPISPLQWLVLAICFGINLLDGFDIQAIAYAAPEIRTAWGIEAAALGIILSAGFVGMAVGALTMGPVSDRIGRKPTILICMALIGLST
ncbi:MAG: MFS transporter, partial [Gammaproteobacteria bacterium]|nr:MFS transporter [Gammaproteobacteria bacterium]